MSTPQVNSVPVSSIGASLDYRIDALLYGVKWGGGVGMPVTMTYSFPDAADFTYLNWDTTGVYGPTIGSGEPWGLYSQGLVTAEQAAAKSALDMWSSVANIQFVKVDDNPTSVGDIRFAWTNTPWTGQAWAYYPSTAPSGGDVWLNALAMWDGFAPGDYGYLTALHELGHVLGLKHSFEAGATLPVSEDGQDYSIMSYTALAGVPNSWADFNPTTPMLYDIAAIQYLYGANNSYNTGDTIYTYSQGLNYYQTIWDAGGTDTIVWSASTESAIIDLNAGAWSDLGNTLTYWDAYHTYVMGTSGSTVAIYYTVTIENAEGGQAADILIGNQVANRLKGGGGDDSLDGRGGSDTLIGGTGNDIYTVDLASDLVYENLGEGVDQVNVCRRAFKTDPLTVGMCTQI